ncbi:hypothetical protein J132_04950 [Termitomyces sp. J132]|nr:hypothetical protein J132_04950 [Termitomyces sp. J132]
MVDMGLDFVVGEDKLEVWSPPAIIGLTLNSLGDRLYTQHAIIMPTKKRCIVLPWVNIIQSITNKKATHACVMSTLQVRQGRKQVIFPSERAVVTIGNDPAHHKPLNRQGATMMSVDTQEEPLFHKRSLLPKHIIMTVNKQNKEEVGHVNDAPSKKRRRGNEESTSCHELVLYTGLNKNSSQDDNDTALPKLQILSLEQRLAKKIAESNETQKCLADIESTNTELEHTLNTQCSDLQCKTIELEDSAEQVAWLQAYADHHHHNEIAKEKNIRFHAQRALVAMTILAQTFTTECDSSSKQLTDQMESSEQQLLLSQGECNRLRLDLKQIKGDLNNTTNNKEILVATIGHLKIQLSTLQETHQNTLEQLGSVKRERKSLRECMAADQKQVNEKIAELDAAKIVISDFQAKLEAQSEESTVGHYSSPPFAPVMIQRLQSQLQTAEEEQQILEIQISVKEGLLQQNTAELAASKDVQSEMSMQSAKASEELLTERKKVQENAVKLAALESVKSDTSTRSATEASALQDQLSALQEAHRATQIERDNLQVQYDQALEQMQEARLQFDQAQKLIGKLRVEKSTHEDAVTKLKQRISALDALEGKVSTHPAQSNETTQAEPSAAEHPSDEDVVLDVADQNGYEPDMESEDDSDRMIINVDDIPSTTNSRPACYKGQQQTVSDFADGRPYCTGKQKENSPNPSMPVDYRVNSYYL